MQKVELKDASPNKKNKQENTDVIYNQLQHVSVQTAALPLSANDTKPELFTWILSRLSLLKRI